MRGRLDREALRAGLEKIYARYNDASYRVTDPVEYLYRYASARDQEVVGLISALLAYGNVTAIRASVEKVLARLGPEPSARLADLNDRELDEAVRGFRHRWTGEEDLADLLRGVKVVQREYGSLGVAFAEGMERGEVSVRPALIRWIRLLKRGEGFRRRDLLSDPAGPSACKRLNLYLRWMIRADEIDPGVWSGCLPDRLLMPVDVHVHRIGGWLGWTRRRVADGRTVEEITRAVRKICPEDPVRYDFALTRLGMEGVGDRSGLMAVLSGGGERRMTNYPSTSENRSTKPE